MEIRQLKIGDAEDFQALIIDMYAHIDNLEWFSPMPYDIDNVKGMIEHPRFFIAGLFVDNKLVGVSSLDYKCGKLIGKVDFPNDFDTNKMVEVGFSMVHSSFKGNKAMQLLVEFVLLQARLQGLSCVFTKVHIDNIASQRSVRNKGFKEFLQFAKGVDKEEFSSLSNTEFFSPKAKVLAEQTLEKFKNYDEIMVNYNILVKYL